MNNLWTPEGAPFISAIAAAVSVILSIFALVRPDIEKFWQKKKACIDFHPRPSSKLIVAFRDTPICWIDGTLESVVGNNLISDIALTIIRNHDNAQYDFQWTNWESTQSANPNSIPAYAFLLYGQATINGFFAFKDEARKTRYQESLNIFGKEFSKHLSEKYLNATPPITSYSEKILEDFVQFDKKSKFDALQKLKSAIYWEAGKYSVLMTISTKRPQKQHKFTFKFEITDDDSKLIMDGALQTLWWECGVKNPYIYQIHKEILEFTKI